MKDWESSVFSPVPKGKLRKREGSPKHTKKEKKQRYSNSLQKGRKREKKYEKKEMGRKGTGFPPTRRGKIEVTSRISRSLEGKKD